jgi:Mlc titration factor MtfA (ptsG expression regulator)
VFQFLRHLRRAGVVAAPFPEAWREELAQSVPPWRSMSEEERTKLEKLVQIFLDEKTFEGAGGLVLTDAMRVTIAARACFLVLYRVGLDDPLYPELSSVVVYPGAYRARDVRRGLGPATIVGDEARLGESSMRGVVVLSWQAVREGSANRHDGHDVVLHEFAHQLDAEDGVMDGAPALHDRGRYAAWAHALKPEYDALVGATARGQPSDIDDYGATNPAEFFAVVTELFFEKPAELRARHPELYAQLAGFYAVDPAARFAPRAE